MAGNFGFINSNGWSEFFIRGTNMFPMGTKSKKNQYFVEKLLGTNFIFNELLIYAGLLSANI